jgi:DNA end-binding protein Ku
MPARAIGTATISFGLVSIPTKLYSASQESSRISFNWLHAKCGSRLKQKYHCPVDNETVEPSDMVKGYEFAKGQYVRFTPDEIKALEEKPTQAIEITEFVPASKVDLLYYDKAYYLGPDKGGERAYRLLGKVMEETERVALAKYAARGKQYLVMLRVQGDHLVMQQLHYADEIKPISEVPVPSAEVKDSELKLALQLVEQISTASFDPQTYEDEVKKRMEAMIQEKVDGREISVAPSESPQAQIVDLMAALKASLGADGDDPPRKPAKRVDGKGGKKTTARKSGKAG